MRNLPPANGRTLGDWKGLIVVPREGSRGTGIAVEWVRGKGMRVTFDDGGPDEILKSYDVRQPHHNRAWTPKQGPLIKTTALSCLRLWLYAMSRYTGSK